MDVESLDEVTLDPAVARQIDAIEAGAFRLPIGDPTRELFHLRVAIARGRATRSAAAELWDHCAANPDQMANFEPFWIQAMLASVWLHDFAVVEAWMTTRYGRPVRVLHDGLPRSAPLTVQISIDEARTLTLHLPALTCRQVHAELLLRRTIALLPLLRRYADCARFDAGQIIVNLDDGPVQPGLALCGVLASHYLIPDGCFVAMEGYRKMREYLVANDVPWDARLPIAFWRGGSSGARRNLSLRELPRVRLCEIANSPAAVGLVDAGISLFEQVSPEEVQELKELGYARPFVPETDFSKYRFGIDIDGNTNSWPGLFYKLLCGNAVLKVASPFGFRQWYYDRLRPWVNYVPVEADMSDLLEKVRWLKARDDQAHAIGLRGRALAEAMSLDRECDHAAATIGAAIRHFAGLPDVEHRFGEDGSARPLLRQGWARHGARTSFPGGPVSMLTMPSPSSISDWTLTLEVIARVGRPNGPPGASGPQRLSVAANGEIVGNLEIAEPGPQTFDFSLPRSLLVQRDELVLTFLHPDGEPPARFGLADADWRESVGFRRIALSRRF